MTLKQLEAFYWAAKLGTFAIAAKRLHVTQSSLSKRIAELEANLGQSLFDRNSRRTTLTAAGEILLDKASTMLEFERDIRASLSGSGELIKGICRFGLTELAATTWFPGFAAHMEQRHPNVVLEPTVALSRPIEIGVARGELDLAIVAGPVSAAELRSRAVADIEFVWTSSPTRLRHRMVLSASHFENHPVINNPHDSGLSAAFDNWSAANQIRVGRTIQCNSRAAIIALTIAGVGISFQPRHYVQPLVEQGLLVLLESEPALPRLTYNLISRNDDDRVHIRTMVDLVQQEADFSAGSILWGGKPP